MSDLFAQVDAEAPAVFEERAAIREYDAGLTRAEAERLGLLDTDVWKTACYVQHFLRLTPKQQAEFLSTTRAKQGDAALAPLIAALPAERQSSALAWVSKTFGAAVFSAVSDGLARLAVERGARS